MSKTIKLPDLGEGATSGTVVAILIAEGDTIEKGQSIIELENEKAVAPIPASAGGKVKKIHVSESDEISTGDTLLIISDSESEEKASTEQREEDKGADAAAPSDSEEDESQETTEGEEETAGDEGQRGGPPTVRRIAHQLGIDLTQVPFRERGGRVSMENLRDYVQGLMQAAAKPAEPRRRVIDYAQWGPIYKRPMTPTRRAISRAMSRVNANVPQVTQFAEADITDLMQALESLNAAYEERGLRLTLTVRLLGALVPLLKKFPSFNASVDATQNEVIFKEYIHVGIAVDTPKGLLVPVIRDVDKKTPAVLAEELEKLAGRARTGELSREQMIGGTFTLSNQGSIGGAHFTPLVNLPETAILGVGRAAKRARVRDNGDIEARLILPLSLSYDHRVIDGADAARFVTQLVEEIERDAPDELNPPASS